MTTRAPYQVLIIPFHIRNNKSPEFAITKRSDMNAWQFLSGGGEGVESPAEAAKREVMEEAGIPEDYKLIKLDSVASIPVNIAAARRHWGTDVYVIPEYCFAVDVGGRELVLSAEHIELKWLEYKDAVELLKWDSNRVALWELRERISQIRNPG
ncbi:NUDIX pyrophosphatase [Candidatus Riflebacteria bacterium]